jgi:hypothetical protein
MSETSSEQALVSGQDYAESPLRRGLAGSCSTADTIPPDASFWDECCRSGP